MAKEIREAYLERSRMAAADLYEQSQAGPYMPTNAEARAYAIEYHLDETAFIQTWEECCRTGRVIVAQAGHQRQVTTGLQPASSFDMEHRVWFVMDSVVAYDPERDVALRVGRTQRAARNPGSHFFLWGNWLNRPSREREALFTLTASSVTEAIQKANRWLERENN